MAHLPSDDTPNPKHRGPDNRLHVHQPGFGAESRGNFILSAGILLHVFLVLAEVAAGFWENSAALLADAGRNLSSGLGLGLAWWCGRPTQHPGRYPYGFNSLPFQGSLYTALGLCALLGFLLLATIDRLRDPRPVSGMLIVLLAGVGLLLHAGTAWLLVRGQRYRVNGRSGYRYLFTDALVSLGVALGGALLNVTGWQRVDAFLAVGLLGVIAYGCWGLLTTSRLLRPSAVDVDAEQVRAFLLGQPGVREVNKLRIWALNPADTALSVHLVRPHGDDSAFIEYLQEALQKEFNISQSTVQLEHETYSPDSPGGGY
jgi:cobalt-zinc-cadmium efflux system protein